MKKATLILDAKFLREHGFDALTVHQGNLLIAEIYRTAEQLVGREIAEKLSTSQLNQFEELIDSGDDEGSRKWLDTNFPDYADVTQGVLTMIGQVIGESATAVRASDRGL